jgi:hypothetical protein
VDGESAGHLLHPADPAALILAETPRALPFAAGPVIPCSACPPAAPLFSISPPPTAHSVTAVEPHPRIAALVRPLLKESSTILKHADPRLFLAQTEIFPQDLILFPERGLFGGPVGLQTLGEDTLFTTEALRSALHKLTPTGNLAFNVWLDEPLRHAPRLVISWPSPCAPTGIERPATM